MDISRRVLNSTSMTVPISPLSADSVLLKQAMAVTLILAVKFFVCIMFQGHARIKSGSRPPEDTKMFPKDGPQSFDGRGKFKSDDEKGLKMKENEIRWVRLISNDLENIPLGLIVAWGSLLCKPNPMLYTTFLWLFCLGRVIHSYAFATAMQPLRSYAWMAGIVGSLGMGAVGLLNALTM
jgi:glutathione S-transferase